MKLLSRLGASWMLVAGVSFAFMGLLVKLSAPYFSAAELVFYRSLFGFVMIGVLVLLEKRPLYTPYLYIHLIRSAAGLISLWLFFYALSHLPLATAVTLNYTSPLFLALLLTLVAREKLHPMLLLALSIGFVGVMLILKPHIQSNQWVVSLMGVLSGFGAGVSYLTVRTLGAKGEPEWRIVFYFSGFSAIVMAFIMIFSGRLLKSEPIHLAWEHLGLLMGVGVAATIGQLTMTRAYRYGKTLLVANLAYSTIVFSSLMGWLFFSEWLSVSAWLGVAIVIATGLGATWLTK